ncbi:MAG TPA: NAD(P)/FAD-dependent oxidoreductase [Saprospiraceae bacterium]|nr:NAD(P)/FAD-dependent oxidoreductase [Saprospiraceae bacterium]
MDSIVHYDVIIIGAGQAGLSTSYLLKQNSIDHIVLDRGEIGESWRKRWDSFFLNSPNKFNLLPGDRIDPQHADGFMSGQQYIEKLVHYSHQHQLPVQTNTEVIAVTKSPESDFFNVAVNRNGQSQTLFSKSVVVASGGQNFPILPSISKQFPSSLFQIHSDDYRHPDQLPKGAVLIIGSATSGVQIAEELAATGKKVYMSTSAVARIPRQYRGLDCIEWLSMMGFFDKPTAMAEPHELHMKAPLMSGIGDKGHTLSLQSLQKQGVILLGYLKSIQGYTLTFEDNLIDHLQFGDMFSGQVKGGINQFIEATNNPAPAAEIDEADQPVDLSLFQERILELDLNQNNITSVIWTTGFTGNFNWIKLPVLNEKGQPIHDNGVSAIPNLYFMGIPWLRNLKSSLIYGTKEDAEAVTTSLLQNLHSNVKVIP